MSYRSMILISAWCMFFSAPVSKGEELLKEWNWNKGLDSSIVLKSADKTKNLKSQIVVDEKISPENKVLEIEIEESTGDKTNSAEIFFIANGTIKAGDKYRIHFKIRSSSLGTIGLTAVKPGKDWLELGNKIYKNIDIGESWKDVNYEFVADKNLEGTILVPHLLFGGFPQGSKLFIGSVKFERLENHLPLSLNKSWTLFIDPDEKKLPSGLSQNIPAVLQGKEQALEARTVSLRDDNLNIEELHASGAQKKLALLYNEFDSPEDGYMQLGAAADWWFEFSVNGTVIYSTLADGNRMTNFSKENHIFNFPVRKGRNLICVKVWSGSEGWRFLCGEVPYHADLNKDKIIEIVRGAEWRPVRMEDKKMTGSLAVKIDEFKIKPGTALDLSRHLEVRSIDRNGRVIANKNGKLVFEATPEIPVRFKGFNWLGGSWNDNFYKFTHEEIEEYVEQIHMSGYTIIRTHFLDDKLCGKSGMPKYGKDRKTIEDVLLPQKAEDLPIDKDFLDRFDYFRYCLRKKRIYLLMDIMTSFNRWTAAVHRDADPQGKVHIYFDEKYRNNWKAGADFLLNHVNPYTGTKLLDDPQLIGVTCYNEQDVLPSFLEELSPYWQKSRNPENPSAVPALSLDLLGSGTAESREAIAFILKAVNGMADFYISHLRGMGYRGFITNWDMSSRLIDIPGHARMDATAMHGYFNHPKKNKLTTENYTQKLYGFKWYKGIEFENTDIGSSINENSYIGRMACTRFLDRPFMLTEYAHSPYNRYVHEAALMMGAYAALQGWDILIPHSDLVRNFYVPLDSYSFASAANPVTKAEEVISFFAWFRGDVKTALHSVEFNVSDEKIMSKNTLNAISPEYGKIFMLTKIGNSYNRPSGLADLVIEPDLFARSAGSNWFAVLEKNANSKNIYPELVKKLREKAILGPDNITDPVKKVFQSETGEIIADAENETMTVITPRLEGTVLKKNKAVSLKNLRINSCSTPASLTAISLDINSELKNSKQILLIFSTMAVSEHVTFTSDYRKEIDMGNFPVLLKTGKIDLSLKHSSGSAPKLYALNMDGTREEEIKLSFANGELNVLIDTTSLKYPTPFFELVFQ